MKKPATPPKKPASKVAPKAATKPAPARITLPDRPSVSSGNRLAAPHFGATAENKLVERFAFLEDERVNLSALARRFYPDLAPDAARVKLHAHLSATAMARPLDHGPEHERLMALVEDFALFLLRQCQPRVAPAASVPPGRQVDLIWASTDPRTVEAVDNPTGRFRLFIPTVDPMTLLTVYRQMAGPTVKGQQLPRTIDEAVSHLFGAPEPTGRPTLDVDDFGSR